MSLSYFRSCVITKKVDQIAITTVEYCSDHTSVSHIACATQLLSPLRSRFHQSPSQFLVSCFWTDHLNLSPLGSVQYRCSVNLMCSNATSYHRGVKAIPQDSVSYDEASARLNVVAEETAVSRYLSGPQPRHLPSCQAPWIECTQHTSLPLVDAVGSRCTNTMHAPHSTPLTDTSAMDGYVVNASSTAEASETNPLRLRIIGSIAAGDAPSRQLSQNQDSVEQAHICAEIMTGACFPYTLPYLDSVVKVEDVSVEQHSCEESAVVFSYIVLTRPVKTFQHRRPAGSDFAKGDLIIEHGTIVQPKHVAALASLGITEIKVSIVPDLIRSIKTVTNSDLNLRVGVLSTGSEIVSGLDENHGVAYLNSDPRQAVPDSNGPYIVSNLKASFPTVATEYLGIVRDDEEEMVDKLRGYIYEDEFDIIITSGGVSKGRHDLVRHVIETRLNGRVVFHGAKIRPGAPILLASFDHVDEATHKTDRRQTILFGVPGNPLAAAVALRFFVFPYILATVKADPGVAQQQLQLSQRTEDGRRVVPLQRSENDKGFEYVKPVRTKPVDCTVFWLARWQSKTLESVELVEDQASYKLKGLLKADCWVTVPKGSTGIQSGDLLLASPL